MVKVTKKTTNVNKVLQKNRVYKSQTNKYIRTIKQNLKKGISPMKNYNEINNEEIVNEVNYIMNTVTEDKLNKLHNEWKDSYERNPEIWKGDNEYGINLSKMFDENSEHQKEFNEENKYTITYETLFEDELDNEDEDYPDEFQKLYSIEVDKNNHFYLVNTSTDELYIIK